MFWKFESCDNCCFITDRNFLFTKPHWSKKQCFYFHHIKNCEIATKEKISLSLKSNVANWQKTQSVFFFFVEANIMYFEDEKNLRFLHIQILSEMMELKYLKAEILSKWFFLIIISFSQFFSFPLKFQLNKFYYEI